MRLTSEDVLGALARTRGRTHSERTLLRAAGAGRTDLTALRLLLQRLMRDGRVERVAGRYRLSSAVPEGDRPARPQASGARTARSRSPRGAGAAESATRTRRVGVVERRAGRTAVVPLRDETPWRIELPRHAQADAAPGDVVEVRFERDGRARSRPRVTRIFGRPGDPDADFEAVSWHRGLRIEFPRDALAEAEAANEEISAAERTRRRDLTALPFLTIDPATARDHDDAVCVEPLARGGFRLRVAIADVAAFVPEGSALDREALRRGNSIYFPDRAIPMLPHRLSGDVCSLRPGVDRLVRVVELELDREAVVHARRFEEGVICSRARLIYEDAAAVMEERDDGRLVDPAVRAQLIALRDVANALARRRLAAGAIEFELPAAEVVQGEDGRPIGMVAAVRTVAHRAIEEAMLAANRAVAEALDAAGIACIHRVHEPPDPDRLSALSDLLARFGLLDESAAPANEPRRAGSRPRQRTSVAVPSGGATLGAREIAAALRRAIGRPEERLVHLVALRSMKQARYVGASLGHFALAFEAYLHFTSPIRRYADLVAHRALRDLLQGDAAARARNAARESGLDALGEALSAREREAVAAEREMVDLKKCVHLKTRVGEITGGVISGVAVHGLYVTLDDTFADGLVHASRLPGRFDFDEAGHAFVERRGSRRFRLGDPLRVRISAVDVARGRVRLDLVADDADLSPRRSRSPAGRAPRSRSRSDRPGRGSAGARSRRRPESR